MSERFELERVKQDSQGDGIFLLLVLLLVGVGVVALFSSSYYTGTLYEDNPMFFLKKRLIALAVGAVLYGFASRLPLEWIKKLNPIWLMITLALLLFTFIPGIGREVMGGVRWIKIGPVSFQPSELAKVTLVLYLASMLSKNEGRMDEPVNTVLPPLLMSAIFVGIILAQNDFSTAIFIFLLALSIFFIAGIKFAYFLLIGIVAIPLTVVVLFTKEHRVERIITFLEPELDPFGTGFQIIAAKTALADGGFWGSGLGAGVKKLGRLPEVHSDFLFASLGEEIGFIGISLIIALFLLFAIKGYSISLGTKDRFSYFLGFGLTTAILFQAFFNMAVVSGLVPATGIPLPFFSAGGSSIMITLIMCGLIQNIARGQGRNETKVTNLFSGKQWDVSINRSILEGQGE